MQVIVVPCGLTATLEDEIRSDLMSYCENFIANLVAAGIRAKGDTRDNYSPGWKFNHWELKVCAIYHFLLDDVFRLVCDDAGSANSC